MFSKVNVFTGPVVDEILSEAEVRPQDTKPKIVDSRHPSYWRHHSEWRKWRLTYAGGQQFLDTYLEQFSNREDGPDFEKRKKITPIPTFAKAAVNDIKNSIFQRMADVARKGGPPSYQNSINGENGGVNRRGGSMNWLIGDQILPELLTMKRVGVFVDSPPILPNETQESRLNKHPYLYRYEVENILNWAWKEDGSRMELSAVLLRDYREVIDATTRLPTGVKEIFRLMWIADDGVHIRFLDKDDKIIATEIILNIPKLPFILFEISDSLLTDCASYQIALLNLKSSDVAYALKGNFPFYVEQRNQITDDLFAKQPTLPNQNLVVKNDGVTLTQADPFSGCFTGNANTKGSEITVGSMHGRSYGAKLDKPDFINPSPDPLKVSMELQGTLKEDIRLLINLALSNIKPQNASAESKAMDQIGLESGLSYIGLELEHGERQIGEIWALYEKEKPPTVKYPERYSLKTDEEQRKEASELKDQQFSTVSKTYQKAIAKRVATVLLGPKVSSEELQKIYTEIDNGNAVTADPTILDQHLKSGLVGTETASLASGYGPDELAKAKKDQAERLARIAASQSSNPAARGLPDPGGPPASQEKTGLPTRGPA